MDNDNWLNGHSFASNSGHEPINVHAQSIKAAVHLSLFISRNGKGCNLGKKILVIRNEHSINRMTDNVTKTSSI